MESTSLDRLIDRLRAETRVWVRAAANRPDDSWRLTLLEITIGAAPTGWMRRRWQYDRAVFLATAPSGATVADWIARGRIPLRPPTVRVDLSEQVHVERRESRFGGIFGPLDWPSVVWALRVNNDLRQMLHEELVADDAPAFINFDHAAAAFFAIAPSPSRSFAGSELIVREQDLRARIASVRVRVDELIVTVEGYNLGGTRLTLSGETGASRKLTRRSREIHLPFDPADARGAWLALHRDRALLDRRLLDPVSAHPDIEVEVEPATRVEALISRGEGPMIEFKQQMPTSSPQSIMKTVAAFANGAGGTILVGVHDEGHIVGLSGQDPRGDLDRLTALITDWVRPPAPFTPEIADVKGATVLIISVIPGAEPPYGVGTTDRQLRYYVRRGATSLPAAPADLRTLLGARRS